MSNTSATLPELADWQCYQREFTAYIRAPKQSKQPRNVPPQRMKLYAELLYNNIEGAVSACFPILSKLVGVRKWRRLVREFYAIHACHTPYFRQVPDEFIQFLQTEWTTQADYPDFTLELAHYEWIELALSISNRDEQCASYQADGDLLMGIPLLNPVMANLVYRYPVHRIAPKYRPTAPPDESSYLLVYRNANDEIKFNVQNAVTARLIELLIPHQLTGQEALIQLGTEMQHPDPATLIQFGTTLLADLHQHTCILGTLTSQQVPFTT